VNSTKMIVINFMKGVQNKINIWFALKFVNSVILTHERGMWFIIASFGVCVCVCLLLSLLAMSQWSKFALF
jgi:hypothetical protein